MPAPVVRSLVGTVTGPPPSPGFPGFETIYTKLYYPAIKPPNATGFFLPPDPSGAPYPLVVVMGCPDCSMDSYQWLAVRLVMQGLLVLTYNWVYPIPSGEFLLNPGFNTSAYQPGTYGVYQPSLVLPSLLDDIKSKNEGGSLRGLIDTTKIVVGGHSDGAVLALDSGTNGWFPSVKAVFSYGGHTAAPISFGLPPGTFLPLNTSLPYLVIGGTRDGLVYTEGQREYGITWPTPYTPFVLTWEQALKGGYQNQYLLVSDGATHFSISYPADNTTSSVYRDFEPTSPPFLIRELIAEAVSLFISAEVQGNKSAAFALDRWLTLQPPLAAIFKRK